MSDLEIAALKAEIARLEQENVELKKRLPKPPVTTFYKTRVWREARYKVIKKYGKKCMACGAEDPMAQVDHIISRVKRPDLALDESNLQVLCKDCNIGKGYEDETDWRPKDVTTCFKP